MEEKIHQINEYHHRIQEELREALQFHENKTNEYEEKMSLLMTENEKLQRILESKHEDFSELENQVNHRYQMVLEDCKKKVISSLKNAKKSFFSTAFK